MILNKGISIDSILSGRWCDPTKSRSCCPAVATHYFAYWILRENLLSPPCQGSGKLGKLRLRLQEAQHERP